MEYLLGASLSSFIAACVAVLVLEPRVQHGPHLSAGTAHGPGAESATRPCPNPSHAVRAS